ncbi:MAG: hypothetical protein H6712_23090 [Myxococcales bacterium]|nr:hypothetical protein [Myxococcales bacterium]MCB9716762.1 hypothetical protein [Myxococcales bacterium]
MVALALVPHKWQGGGDVVELVGNEAWTLELRGRLPVTAAEPRAAGLPLRELGGRVEVGLLVLAMEGLGSSRLPGPRLSYHEALWRVGVVLDDVPGWLGLACDLDRALVGALGRMLIRYPVRRARIGREDDGEAWTLRVRAGGATLALRATPGDEVPPALRPRPLVVGRAGRWHRVPWREDPAAWRRAASIEVLEDGLSARTLGAAVEWDEEAVAHRGRIHRCGLATRWRPATEP